jgi:3-hydroxyacyl-CoA dehydrogenase/enoyl-CoA hydratase/3-hydroxybutyryl-CoA epimerase/3-hydroxyacyl-CoA dehydrogenase/enoyl-CoA hydratase/3-hydroxybutyryl-CoA epimerase/enoyl-CoA isomerase
MGVFSFEELEGQIGVITFDTPNRPVNTLGRVVLEELAELVTQLENRTDLNGLLFKSGKSGQFIAGADLNELGALASATREQVLEAVGAGHELFARLSQLPFPTVALIDGACMGGGTELILSLDERVVSTSGKTKIALPEVNVGLIPGWGGTQRLPRLIGIHHAIDMITSGKPLTPAECTAKGLAFDAVAADDLVDVGLAVIGHLRDNEQWKAARQKKSQPLGLTTDQMAFAFAVSEGAVKGKTKGQYPAPLAALKAMKEGINRTLEEGLKVEREVSLDVVGSTVSANLIGVFFMNNQISKDPGFGGTRVEPRTVTHVGVLGTGQMGAGIATANARRGVLATMVDIDNERLAWGMAAAQKAVADRIKIGRATPQDMADMLSLLNTSTSKNAFGSCDVVVEAITENESLKTKMYGELHGILADEAILASNTSTISITRMAESAPNPERFVGMHFFYPVDRMQLVEVIRGEKTDDETVETIVKLAQRIGKIPIVMKDCPGFLVNRVLLPYMNEALLLLCEGASMDAIDKAATKFGMPMGPIALHDLVGLDVALSAGQVVASAYSDRAEMCPLLQDLVDAGRLGKKSSLGFRSYTGKKGRPAADPTFDEYLAKHRTGDNEFAIDEITDRLFLPMLLEATRTLEDGIVSEPTHVDMGVLLGIGFPTFRGGILHWCDSEGAAAILNKLESYASLGKRFETTDLLNNMATNSDSFFKLGKTA